MSAISNTNIRYRGCKYGGSFEVGSSLRVALNKPEVGVQQLMKWQWQICEFVTRANHKHLICLHPIDVDFIHVDAYENIVMTTVFRHSNNLNTNSDLTTATSMINSYNTMVEKIDTKKKSLKHQRELKIFNIISQYIITNKDLNTSDNIIQDVFVGIDELCELVDNGIIEELAKI